LGGPNRSVKTPVSIVIWVTEVRNPPPQKGDSTRVCVCVCQTALKTV